MPSVSPFLMYVGIAAGSFDISYARRGPAGRMSDAEEVPSGVQADVVRVARRGDLTSRGRRRFRGLARIGAPLDEAGRRRRRREGRSSPPSRPRWSGCAGTTAGWRWRTRSCAGPRRTSPRTSSQNDLPAGPRPGRRGHPGAADLRGAGFSTQAFYAWRQRRARRATSTTRTSPTRSSTPTATTRSSATGSSPTSSSRRPPGRRAAGVAALPAAAPVVHDGQEGPPRQAPRASGPRRPGPAPVPAARPDAIWFTDITEHPTAEGKLYCCAIKDVFSNRIVGYSIGERMTAQLATRALRAAIARRQPTGTVVVHSDRGGQFRSRAFRAVLAAAGLTGSMGRVASAGDNAAMESFFSLLQRNVLDRRRWRIRSELAYAISSGSSTPTTAVAGNAHLASSPRSTSSSPSPPPGSRAA